MLSKMRRNEIHGKHAAICTRGSYESHHTDSLRLAITHGHVDIVKFLVTRCAIQIYRSLKKTAKSGQW